MPIYTVTLKEGEKIILPADANIITVIEDGATVTSSCNNLPINNEVYGCYEMNWAISTTSGDNAALEDDDTVLLDTLTLGGTTYTLGINSDGTITTIKSLLEALIPQSLFKIFSGYKDGLSRRAEFGIRFKTIASLIDGIKLKIVGVGFPNGLYLTPFHSESCDCYTGHDENACDASEDGGTP